MFTYFAFLCEFSLISSIIIQNIDIVGNTLRGKKPLYPLSDTWKCRNFEGEGKTLNSEARFFLPLQPYPFPAPIRGLLRAPNNPRLTANKRFVRFTLLDLMHKGARELNGVQKCSVCCRRESDVFIVSLQQTVHSALLRGFEPYSATGSMCTNSFKMGRCTQAVSCRLFMLELFMLI